MNNYADEIAQSQSTEQDDSNRYETDTKHAIENLYHSWLGEVPNLEGVYERDYNLKRSMNQKCASMLRQEILSAFFDNMNFSELSEMEVEEIASYKAEYTSQRLKYFYEEFEVNVHDIVPISDQVYSFLKIGLNIARNGGMKLFKVQRGQINIHKVERAEQ